MKVPYTIDPNTQETYKSAPRCSRDHLHHAICSGNFAYDRQAPERLSELCVRKIAEHWAESPVSEFPMVKDRNFLLEILDTKLPLSLLAEHIGDDVFWKRAFRERWSSRMLDEKRPYIQHYMEAHCSDELENMHPKAYDPEKISELVNMWAPHVRSLRIKSMIPSDPPESNQNWINKREDLGKSAKQYIKTKSKTQYRDHIPLSGILSSLPSLTEIHLTFALRNAGSNFSRDLFQTTPADVRHLVRGLEKCTQLKVLRITSSDLDCGKLKAVLKALGECHSLRTLDLSHCRVADAGTLSISKYIIRHPALKELVLVNNKIGPRGAEGLGYALSHPASRLLTLDLRMNTFVGSLGASHIGAALLRGSVLQNLNLSACGINRDPVEGAPDCGQLIASALAAGRSPLRELDLSVNDLGPTAGAALAAAMDAPCGGGGPSKMSVRAGGCGKWEAIIARSALRNAARRRMAALRFRRGASRLLAAARVAKAIGIMEADPIDLAKHLTARPSYVSVVSIESEAFTQLSLPEAGDFEPFNFNIPPLKDPFPTSPESSATTVVTSRRSSFHGSTKRIPIETKEVRKSALVRRSSVDGSLLTRSADSQRRIKIFVSKTQMRKFKV